MTREECIALLGDGWRGYDLIGVRREPAPEGGEQVLLQLVPVDTSGACSGCGQFVDEVHDYVWRNVRDLPLLGAKTILVVHRRRVACPDCGPRLEALAWLDPYARVTRRLADSVARLCSVLPIKHVAEHFCLGWHQVKEIDKHALRGRLLPIDLRGVDVIAMDEFSLRKGYKYATVIACARTRRVLYVGHGRGRESVRPFFELLGPDGCAQLKACATDLNAPYHVELAKHAPQAKVIADPFHVLQNFGRYVIDRVRVDIANKLRADKTARRVVKGSRWLLLKQRDSLRDAERVRLDELLAANTDLMTVYVLREDLRELWRLRNERLARRHLADWLTRAAESGIPPLARFASNLAKHTEALVAYSHFPLGTNFLEGMNNKIKVIKRMAYGFRDHEYFFLKIHAAFPGIPR
jgi:transposase